MPAWHAARIGARPHVVLLPGLAIFIVVLALNPVGDAVRDLLDPRARAA